MAKNTGSGIDDPGEISDSILRLREGKVESITRRFIRLTGEIVWLIKKNRQQEHAR
jgi:hypothetical protein